MLTRIAIVLGVVLAALVGLIATRPSEFRVARSRTVSAPPEVVHAYVNDFRKWSEWSPWETRDPALRREFSGAPAGPGAVYSWVGNKEVGEGRMTITDSRPPQSITIRLEFIKPFAATNVTQFDFTPSGSGTHVTWAMTGRCNFIAKGISLFMDMDQMVGTEFEKGLATLDMATAAAKRAAGTLPTS
jgi:uncharacterized protein YndB with AHSA1/START domain